MKHGLAPELAGITGWVNSERHDRVAPRARERSGRL